MTTETLHHAFATSRRGRLLLATADGGVVALLLGDDDDALLADLTSRFPNARLEAGSSDDAARAAAAVDDPNAPFPLPLAPRGTPFQLRVWAALQRVAAGRTVTYTELAVALGSPGSSRAVAGACAANPIAVAIPCHRVLRQDGALSGYRWGVERKRQLLRDEGALLA